MNKVLITGGAGFIGSTLANELSQNFEIYIIDDFSKGKINNLKEDMSIKIINGSVLNSELMEKILKENSFVYIFHFAAIVSVQSTVEDPVTTHKVNLESTIILCDLIKRYQLDLKRLIFSSSSAVYGEQKDTPINEKATINLLSPYAIDKYAAESYIQFYGNNYNIPTSVVRFFNVFGPNQRNDSSNSGVIALLLKHYLLQKDNIKEPFLLYGDGKQTRDFICISEVIRALIFIMETKESIGKIYNIGSGYGMSIIEIINFLNEVLNVQLNISYQPKRLGEIRNSKADISSILRLGFVPKKTVENSLREIVSNFFKINKSE